MSFQVNPAQIIQMIKNGQNPQQLMLKILEGQANIPMGANLLNLAKGNKTAEIEQIARNIAQSRGIDFEKEFNAFKQTLGINKYN